MARIQKRQTKSGATSYVVKWRTPDGHDRSKGGFTTRKAAHAYATDIEHARLRGTEYNPKAGNATFREVAQAWLASRHDLKQTTLAGYRYALAPAQTCRQPRRRLGIDATFGGYPINAITRQDITAWVQRLTDAGKRPTTIRQYVLVVRQVLAQAVADNQIAANPADYVKLPGTRGKSTTAVVDDPAQFLTAQQVQALVDATPWPYNVMLCLAAWSGLRAGELAGLQVADVELPASGLGAVNVRRTLVALNGALAYQTPKTKGSKRKVPITANTTAILRDYLAEHPNRSNPAAPLWPAIRLTGRRQGAITPDWAQPLRHTTFYRCVFRPAVARAGLPPALTFHALRHTYASLCVAAGIPPLEISRFMGHSTVTTTLGIYAHLFTDDHSEAMAALGGMGQPALADNVVRLRPRAR